MGEILNLDFSKTNDRYLSSCCSDGKFMIHDRQKEWENVFKYSCSDRISKTAFSYLKNNLVSCGSLSGELRLFDFEAQKLNRMFLEHIDEITGIKFSQINDSLLISAGMDKRLNFYDTKQCKVIKNWTYDEPITSLDFYHDGLQIIYSTIKGTINMIDLRKCNTPIMTLKGQEGKRVKSTTFGCKYKKRDENTTQELTEVEENMRVDREINSNDVNN
mmetsp:Transcript_63682/g.54005  ORF Transcript_63682/g.54005 Transcript_63682/m.54005 type:complete len:217 (+) Transcript_63682:348-998(+)